MAWIGALIGLVGSQLADSGGGNQQTTKNEIDPRLAQYLYGASGQGGLLNYAGNLSSQQANQGGLNPLQTAGLEMQRQALLDPRYTQGLDQIRGAGSGLLGQPIAGNPFTQGQARQPQMPQAPQLPPMSQAGGGLVSQGPQTMSMGNINANTVTGPGMNAPMQPGNLGLGNPISAAYQPITQQSGPPPQASITQDDLRAWQAQQSAEIARSREPKPWSGVVGPGNSVYDIAGPT